MDTFDVVPVAVEECRRQQVGVRELGALLLAWDQANLLARAGYLPTESFVRDLAAVIEPRNKNGYRRTPVTFSNGGSSASADSLTEAMWRWADSIQILSESPEGFLPEDARALTRHLLWMHPWEDGNGRTAWVVFNWLTGNLVRGQAVPLPDFQFAQ